MIDPIPVVLGQFVSVGGGGGGTTTPEQLHKTAVGAIEQFAEQPAICGVKIYWCVAVALAAVSEYTPEAIPEVLVTAEKEGSGTPSRVTSTEKVQLDTEGTPDWGPNDQLRVAVGMTNSYTQLGITVPATLTRARIVGIATHENTPADAVNPGQVPVTLRVDKNCDVLLLQFTTTA